MSGDRGQGTAWRQARSPEDLARACQHGATDQEIHDTVLIAAAFCMYNRYVDGLATWAPRNLEGYRERASIVARDGYLRIPERVEASQNNSGTN